MPMDAFDYMRHNNRLGWSLAHNGPANNDSGARDQSGWKPFNKSTVYCRFATLASSMHDDLLLPLSIEIWLDKYHKAWGTNETA